MPGYRNRADYLQIPAGLVEAAAAYNGEYRDEVDGAHRPSPAGALCVIAHPHPHRTAVATLAGAVETVLRDHPDGLSGSERWIGPL